MKRVYIGASMLARDQVAAVYNPDLRSRGYDVVSTWAERDESDESARAIARRDFDDLMTADTLVVLVDPPSSSGGLATELGIMLGLRSQAPGLKVYAIGRSRNVFDELADRRFAQWSDFLRWLDVRKQSAARVAVSTEQGGRPTAEPHEIGRAHV